MWIAAAVAGTQAAPDVRAGRDLAIDACSACHQVTQEQKSRPPVFDRDEQTYVPAPSFNAIAIKYFDRPSALRAFILAPAHPMREQNWDPADLAAVVAFIRSLKHPASTSRSGR
jgi:mono/diheme cytochrome c family protein